jgi:ubiquitin-conjugating enzyme (huntingtin interacting protein 2)
MANIAAQRIRREFKEVIKSEEVAKCAIKVELLNDSYTELKGEITGPPDTAYEGGTFVLEIKVPETYPFNPPKVILKIVIKIFTAYFSCRSDSSQKYGTQIYHL